MSNISFNLLNIVYYHLKIIKNEGFHMFSVVVLKLMLLSDN